MDEVLSKGTLFPEELVSDLYNKVKGKSSITGADFIQRKRDHDIFHGCRGGSRG